MHHRLYWQPEIGGNTARIEQQKWPCRFDLPHGRPAGCTAAGD